MNEPEKKEPIPSPFFNKADPEHEALLKLIKNPVIVISIRNNGLEILVDNFNVPAEVADNTILILAQGVIARRRKGTTGT